jgi:sialate O-acetylesterase
MIKKVVFISNFLWAASSSLFAQNIKPAAIFGNNMVMQQGINAPIWGNAKPNQDLAITFAGKTIKTKADENGKWLAKTPKLKAGGPFKMVIASAADSVIFDAVLVGEVWLASGQSNM